MASYARYESLAGTSVFVTGGATGIGADIVRAFAYNEAKVAFVDIQEDAGKAVAEETGAMFIDCDITDTPALTAAIEQVRVELGPIGVLISNAADDRRQEIDEITPQSWDWTFEVNLKAQFFAAQAVRKQMRELGGGVIINFSSISWIAGYPSLTAYATAKSAVLGLTNALARGLSEDNIRVNAIQPGGVVTERQMRLYIKSEEAADAKAQRQMIKRRLLGQDIARLALFLASDQSDMITSQVIQIDAGQR
jgi:NAD(P)-dependent dehydrogenase (short-subunit alcohol dehydrogenase family)